MFKTNRHVKKNKRVNYWTNENKTMEQTWFIKERIFWALFVAYNSTTNTQMLIIRNALLKRCKQLKKFFFLPKWPLKSTAQTNYSRSETIGEESIVGTHGLSLRYTALSREKPVGFGDARREACSETAGFRR